MPRAAPTLTVVLAVAVMTALNAAKPLVVDDTGYWQFARHIATDPADPYGFLHFWYDRPIPANYVLAPPVLPYWWAAAIALFGDAPLAWKLWLTPFALVAALALWRILSWTSPSLRGPLLLIALLSPSVLPSFNLMLDVPSLALGLSALALLVAAVSGPERAGDALVAGLVGGLAMQTKYSALLPFATGLLFALTARRLRTVAIAGGAATAVFVGWEAFVLAVSGESHFLVATAWAGRFEAPSVAQQAIAFGCLLGAASAGLAPLALAVGGAGRVAVGASAAAIAGAFALVAWLPADGVAHTGPFFPEPGRLGVEAWPLLGVLALLGAALGLALVRRRDLLPASPGRGVAAAPAESRLDALVWIWVVVEAVGYFVLSPFPALRRMIGLHVALVVALGRLAERARVPRRTLGWIAAFGVALGLLFAIADLSGARARRDAVASVVAELDAREAGAARGARWFLGHWGFEYYARRAGMLPVVPGESRLRRGDWLVVPRGVHRQQVVLDERALQHVATIDAVDAWPWATLPAAYSGYRPLRPRADAQLRVQLVRVLADFVPGVERQKR